MAEDFNDVNDASKKKKKKKSKWDEQRQRSCIKRSKTCMGKDPATMIHKNDLTGIQQELVQQEETINSLRKLWKTCTQKCKLVHKKVDQLIREVHEVQRDQEQYAEQYITIFGGPPRVDLDPQANPYPEVIIDVPIVRTGPETKSAVDKLVGPDKKKTRNVNTSQPASIRGKIPAGYATPLPIPGQESDIPGARITRVGDQNMMCLPFETFQEMAKVVERYQATRVREGVEKEEKAAGKKVMCQGCAAPAANLRR